MNSMLNTLILILLIYTTYVVGHNVGTTLFNNRLAKECWSTDDLAKLRARKMFQQIVPHQITPDKVSRKYIKSSLRFYRKALRAAQTYSDSDHVSLILKQALADTLGGHLRSEMLPTARFAYYAGYIPYKDVRELHNVFDETKTLLNTKGIGWKKSANLPQWSNLTVVKIVIGSGKFFDPCASIVTKRDSNSCIHLPSPKLDDSHTPTAIAVPFKTGGLFSLTSPHSENILLKYYTTAARCILQRSPGNCRHSDFVNFNNELWHWMKRDVAPHLMDDKLYVAYGGVLRIAAAVQSYGKGLSRRNLFDYQPATVSKWHPLEALTRSYLYVNTDWTAKLYVGIVLLVALVIGLLQMCYSYVFNNAKGCNCSSPADSIPQRVGYATVHSNFSATPRAHTNEKSSKKYSDSKTKSSIGSVKTQKVFDLNENAEKLMDVILSGNEDSMSVTESTSEQESEETAVDKVRRTSPPELATPISQLKIGKIRQGKSSYTTSSTVTHTSGVTYRRRESESQLTSSASDESGSSCSSKDAYTPRKARELTCARRVFSKHTRQTQSTNDT